MITAEDVLVDDLEDNFSNFEGENTENEAEEAPPEAEEEDANKKSVKPKRVVRNPQPKLNEQTLKGPRGLIALPSYFDRVKYKGKGYEEQDLSVVLKTYEYWCHRLFPKYPFDDCIAKIEKLGSKKAVITHIKKIRLDMIDEGQPILNNDLVESDPEDNVNNEFDHLFRNVDIPAPVEITEEQQVRIRLNKEKAEKLRREKLNRAEELSGSQSQNTENLTQYSESGNIDIQNSSPVHSLDDDDDDEDLDSIFDKIRKFSNKQVKPAALDIDTVITDKQKQDDEICEPETAEFQPDQSGTSDLDSQTPDLIESRPLSQVEPPNEIMTTNGDS